MKTIYVVPRPGLNLRNPANPKTFIPQDGTEVPTSMHWTRRQRDGDVIIHQTKPAVISGDTN